METPGKIPHSVHCHTCGAVIDLTGQRSFTHIECAQCGSLSVVPVLIGNYLLLTPLGIGGMGTVYKAMDLLVNHTVALKLLHPKLASNPDYLARFTREAKAAASVRHRNVAQIYSFGALDGQYSIAMELLERGSLDDRISKLGRRPELEILPCILQVAEGLRAAHEEGLLHHDIKPGNILFDAEGVPKIVDFGNAQPSRPAGSVGTSLAWGTLHYTAPEILEGKPEDIRSDIYSLGATFLHALTGHLPPVGSKPTPSDVLHDHAPETHSQSIRILCRMMERDPSRRPASYEELIQELKQTYESLTAPTGAGGRKWIVSLTVSGAVLLTAGVVLWAKRPLPRLEPAPVATNIITITRHLPDPVPVPVVSDATPPHVTPFASPTNLPNTVEALPVPSPVSEVLSNPVTVSPPSVEIAPESTRPSLDTEELKLLEATETELQMAWRRYDFEMAAKTFAALNSQLTTSNAHQRLARNQAVAGWLVEFRKQLMTDVNQQPHLTRSPEERAVRADETRVFWATEYGEVGKRWGDLSPDTLIQLAETHLVGTEMGRRLFALAVFCRQYKLDRLAAGYLKRAVQIAPELRPEADFVFGKKNN